MFALPEPAGVEDELLDPESVDLLDPESVEVLGEESDFDDESEPESDDFSEWLLLCVDFVEPLDRLSVL